MNSRSVSYAVGGDTQSLLGPMGISIAAHFLLVGLVFFSPAWDSDPEFLPSIIDVQMVDLTDLNAAPARKEVAPKEKTPAVKEKEAEVEVAPDPAPKPEPAKEAEVSVAPPKKKSSKSALKYKTFKSKKVIKNALKRVEKKVDSSPPKPLEDTLKKLRDKVAKEGRPAPANDRPTKGDKVSKSGVYGRGSQKEIELIDLYRDEIARIINRNWAYAGGGTNEMAAITFKVMPDGTITDVAFMDRSGNQNLDDSGYRAIVKSSPVRAHPDKLSVPYVIMGLRFSPQGVQ